MLELEFIPGNIPMPNRKHVLQVDVVVWQGELRVKSCCNYRQTLRVSIVKDFKDAAASQFDFRKFGANIICVFHHI